MENLTLCSGTPPSVLPPSAPLASPPCQPERLPVVVQRMHQHAPKVALFRGALWSLLDVFPGVSSRVVGGALAENSTAAGGACTLACRQGHAIAAPHVPPHQNGGESNDCLQ